MKFRNASQRFPVVYSGTWVYAVALRAGASLLLAGCLSGCYAGLAGVVAGVLEVSEDEGDTNTMSVVAALEVTDTRSSPAAVRFTLIDAESDPADVEIHYRTDGSARWRRAALAGDDRLSGLGTSPRGVQHTRNWDFGSQLGTGFTRSVTVSVGILSGSAETKTLKGVGNDPPQIDDVRPPTDEVVGIVNVGLTVSDSSGDLVSIRAEYRDPEERGQPWRTATPATTNPGVGAREFAFTGIQASSAGTDLEFFWDVEKDLGRTELSAKLRFTAFDGSFGKPVEREVPIDNNEPPVITLDAESFVLNPDRSGGIPVPFEVRDAEGDEVRVVFQWSPAGTDFPLLPPHRPELEDILADPDSRSEHRIATERRTYAEGRVVPVDSGTVCLPELASTAAGALRGGLEGREFEILRPRQRFETLGHGWGLTRPVAALPRGDGRDALVLESSPSAWSLREIELATGREVRAVVSTSKGQAGAMTYEPGRNSVLVALDRKGDWWIERVDLNNRKSVPIVIHDASTEEGAVRAIITLGRSAALITLGSSLIRLDYPESGPARIAVILRGLQAPWGLAADPLRADRIYLSERDWNGRGRVLAVDLNSRAKSPVAKSTELSRPEALSLERSRLLVITDSDPEDGTKELKGLDLRRGDAEVFELAPDLPQEVGSIATGPDGLRLVAMTGSDSLLVAGGVEGRRTVSGYDPLRQQISVSHPFEPLLIPGRRWRIFKPSPLRPRPAAPEGRREIFLWDARDAPQGEEVVIRALAYDTETGFPDDSRRPRAVRSNFQESPLVLRGTGTLGPSQSALADLDGDGDLDVATANFLSHDIMVFFQQRPGSFSPEPDLLLGGTTSTLGVAVVVAADLNGDGKLDLVSANRRSINPRGEVTGDVTVFFQREIPGDFPQGPDLALRSDQAQTPSALAVADLEGDGDLDLIAVNLSSHNLTVFLQEGGEFAGNPQVLGSSETTQIPAAVATADLNGDGRLDIVSANRGSVSRNLTVFLQDAPGRFPPQPDRTLGSPETTDGPYHVTPADLDGDGSPDLVCANHEGNNLAVFFQTALAGFPLQPDFTTLNDPTRTRRPRRVRAADVDGDGDLDLVSANVLSDNLAIFLQKSRGEFGSEPDLLLGATPDVMLEPRSVSAADLDGDGDIDLVATNEDSHTVTVFFQRSSGEYATPPHLLGGPDTTIGPSSLAAADLDGDGDLDLVSANELARSLTLFFQRSPGVFSPQPQSLGNSPATRQPTSVAAADLDGDGGLDLIAANAASDNLSLFFQRRSGEFPSEPDRILQDLETLDEPRSAAAADLNNDGILDLVSANARSNNLTLFFQVARRDFGTGGKPNRTLGGPGTTDGPFHVAAADLDGDGDFDLAAANHDGDNLTLFFQESPGGFSPTPRTLGGPELNMVRPTAVAAADLDGDGGVDLVSANSGSHSLAVFLQKGAPGEFLTAPDVLLGRAAVTTGPLSVAAADVDADGDLDLLSANRESDRVALFLQRGPGVFVPEPDLVLGDGEITRGSGAILAVDIDGDGDQDLVSGNRDGNNLSIFYGSH